MIRPTTGSRIPVMEAPGGQVTSRLWAVPWFLAGVGANAGIHIVLFLVGMVIFHVQAEHLPWAFHMGVDFIAILCTLFFFMKAVDIVFEGRD